MELGRSNDDAAPAVERSEVRGHRQQIGKSAALTVGDPSPDHPHPPRRDHLIERRLAAARRQRRIICCARPVDVALTQDVETEQKFE
jgi:hypothetical protein